jgi:hypothetical protein
MKQSRRPFWKQRITRALNAFTIIVALVSSSVHAQYIDYDKAIAYGQSFKSRRQFLEKGLKNQKVQLASSLAKDGMSKYVTFFADYEAVAAAAAQAKQEMREFTIEDAKKLTISGLLFAYVEVRARGLIPTSKLPRRYITNSAHLVLDVDGKVIQPQSKEAKGISEASVAGGKAELEFVFPVDPSIKTKKGKVILIDADGNRHQGVVDFGQIFH